MSARRNSSNNTMANDIHTERRAYVTLLTSDDYAEGAFVLAASLRASDTQYPLVMMHTPDVSTSIADRLATAFDHVVEVDPIIVDDDRLALLGGRPELRSTFTKLRAWALIQYDRVVFLDADTLVLRNVDDLFDRAELSAAPDAGWPDMFNSGVMVLQPNMATFRALMSHLAAHGSLDGGDQGLLNSFFGQTWRNDPDRRLPFTDNVTPTTSYMCIPALRAYEGSLRIVHFIGAAKPWKCGRHADGSIVNDPTPTTGVVMSDHVIALMQKWWAVYDRLYGKTGKRVRYEDDHDDRLSQASSLGTRPASPVYSVESDSDSDAEAPESLQQKLMRLLFLTKSSPEAKISKEDHQHRMVFDAEYRDSDLAKWAMQQYGTRPEEVVVNRVEVMPDEAAPLLGGLRSKLEELANMVVKKPALTINTAATYVPSDDEDMVLTPRPFPRQTQMQAPSMEEVAETRYDWPEDEFDTGFTLSPKLPAISRTASLSGDAADDDEDDEVDNVTRPPLRLKTSARSSRSVSEHEAEDAPLVDDHHAPLPKSPTTTTSSGNFAELDNDEEAKQMVLEWLLKTQGADAPHDDDEADIPAVAPAVEGESITKRDQVEEPEEADDELYPMPTLTKAANVEDLEGKEAVLDPLANLFKASADLDVVVRGGESSGGLIVHAPRTIDPSLFVDRGVDDALFDVVRDTVSQSSTTAPAPKLKAGHARRGLLAGALTAPAPTASAGERSLAAPASLDTDEPMALVPLTGKNAHRPKSAATVLPATTPKNARLGALVAAPPDMMVPSKKRRGSGRRRSSIFHPLENPLTGPLILWVVEDPKRKWIAAVLGMISVSATFVWLALPLVAL
ncbi:Glycogenin-1 [Allomyces arbusculus]|nr:Glycogenin-1 [Allomyces arbusculus]